MAFQEGCLVDRVHGLSEQYIPQLQVLTKTCTGHICVKKKICENIHHLQLFKLGIQVLDASLKTCDGTHVLWQVCCERVSECKGHLRAELTRWM